MDHARFDQLVREAFRESQSRRGMLRGIASGVLGAVWGHLALDDALSKNKNKRRESNRNRSRNKKKPPASPPSAPPSSPPPGCSPDCTNKTCGSNGCGGQCGSCGNGFTCSDEQRGGNCRCPSGVTCNNGAVCRGQGETCQGSTCCPTARVCGANCCAAGQPCVNNTCQSGSSLDDQERACIDLINAHRAANGRGALAAHSQLTAAAERHSQDMATTNVFSHTGSDGTNGGQRISQAGYPWTAWGENIYWNSSDGSANAAFTGWRNSPSHNAYMLSASYNEIGIARVRSTSTGRWYWTTTFGRR